jgi:hypothetical protein
VSVNQSTHDPQSSDSSEGRTFRPTSSDELRRILEEAFHYRGDVTLHLQSGARVQGYLFNRDFGGDVPHVQMFVEGLNGPRQIPCSEIIAISFTGEDTASGNDWEAWARKKESDRQEESTRLEAAARARGHL